MSGRPELQAAREERLEDGDDYSDLDDSRRADALSRLCAEERRIPFELHTGPPLRAVLVSLGADHHLLLLTLPALCADSSSLINIFRELGRHYQDAAKDERVQPRPRLEEDIIPKCPIIL